MADDTQSDGRTNKYDGHNRYTDRQREQDNGGAAPAASLPALTGDAWRPRNGSPVAIYEPILGERRRRRRKADKFVEDLGTATTVANASERLHHALTAVEQSAQDLEQTQERRRLIPLKVEQEKITLGQELLKAQTDFDAAMSHRQDAQVDRQRRRQLDTDDFENVRLKKEAERFELLARIEAAKAQRELAPEIGRRRAEAELHKAEGEALRNEGDAVAERRRRDQQRGPSPGQFVDDMPDELRAPLATATKVARTREWVDRKIAEIKRRAEAERRQLTPDEYERIDQLNDAAVNGEASIRRNGASDVV